MSTTNCIFQQWAWQKFLWATKPLGDGPLFLNQDSIYQVDSYMRKLTQQPGANVVLTDTLQAGFQRPILRTNAAYNSTVNQNFTVYYSIHTSPTMFTAANDFRIQLDSGTLKPNNLASFPVGSLELKVSWVNIDAIPSAIRGNYFIATAALSSGNAEMALLGMHVVGIVENHPEFIWATFEHYGIAPLYNWPAHAASSSSEELLFSTGSIAGTTGINYDSKTETGKTPYKVYELFKYGVPRDSAGLYMGTSQQEPINYDNIDTLNQCVAAQLGDVWKNYFYNGAIWINTDSLTATQQAQAIVNAGGNLDSALPDSIARGSLNNANVTMETFYQTVQTDISAIKVSNLMNCFTCHNSVNSSGNTSPLYISHIFDDYLQLSEGFSKKEIIQKKVVQQRREAFQKIN